MFAVPEDVGILPSTRKHSSFDGHFVRFLREVPAGHRLFVNLSAKLISVIHRPTSGKPDAIRSPLMGSGCDYKR